MGFQSLLIANKPSVFSWSFEKRIFPRGLFAQDLLSKGLIKKFGLSALFASSEKVFIRRFVNQYEGKAPELLKLYKKKLDLATGGKYRSGFVAVVLIVIILLVATKYKLIVEGK